MQTENHQAGNAAEALPEFLTAAEVAARLRVSLNRIYVLLREGRVAGATRVGGRRATYRINRAVFEDSLRRGDAFAVARSR